MELNDVSIVIVTFISENKIFSCLDSISQNHDIFIIENSNNINFKNKVEKINKKITCILTGENKGYAIANNIGLSKVKTKYALVLNPDTKLNKNAIENFIKRAKEYPDFWLMGPGNDQQKDFSIKSEKMNEVDNLKGFAIFFNLKKFNHSFFDENYFLYFEEIDLCKKVKKRGGKIFIDSEIIIKHEGASSVERNKELEFEKNRNWHWMWSTFYFHKKYKGFLTALFLISPNLFSSLIKIIFYQFIFNKYKRDIYYSRLSGILNSILGKKSWYRPSID